jgi:hypothetical protein
MFSKKNKRNEKHIILSDIRGLNLPPIVENVNEDWMIKYLEEDGVVFSHFNDPVFPDAKFHFIFDNHKDALKACHKLNLVGYRAVPDAQFAIVYQVYNAKAYSQIDTACDIIAYENVDNFYALQEMVRRYWHKREEVYMLLASGVITARVWALYTEVLKLGQVLGRVEALLEGEE